VRGGHPRHRGDAGATPAQRRALDLAAGTGLPVLTVPSADELRDRRRRIERVRDIEPEDLLGREPVQLDEAGIGATLQGKHRADHRRRRQHRQRAVPPGGALRPGAAGAVRAERVQPLQRSSRTWASASPHLPLVRLIGDVKDLAHLRPPSAAGGRRWCSTPRPTSTCR
jgi:hypothetical protein